MKSFLPFLMACFLLVGQFGCSDGGYIGGGGTRSTPTPEMLPPDDGGGASPSPTLPPADIPADLSCTGSRRLYVGVHANIIITAADGTRSGVIDAGDTGYITVACSASVFIGGR